MTPKGGFISWWARNSVAANLLMIAIIIVGIVQYINMEREVFPSVEPSQVSVSVSWPGADPQQVEEQIVLRIEEAVSDMDNVYEIYSTAFEGFASVTVDATDDADMTEFTNEVKNRVDGISTFPQDAFPPIVRESRFNQQTVFLSLTAPEDMERREFFRIARDMRDELAALPNGSPLVEVWGVLPEEVSIEVSEESLRRYGLTLSDVANAVRQSSLNLSSGSVRTDNGTVQLAVRNLANTEEEFERIVIRQARDGSNITVGDVATVIDGFVDQNEKGLTDGKESVMFNVQSPEISNVVALSKAIEQYVEDKQDELADGMTLEIWFDFSELYKNRMELVSSNALVGFALVLIVLFLFLRPAVSFWVTIGIIISFIGAFIFLPMVGVSLNMLSLFGLLLVIGIVVDDALVVGESIHRQVERGRKGLTAAVIGTQLVAKPVFYAVLTTMIAFFPFIFVSCEASQFLKHITFTIIFALTFSLIESFMILPAHLAHMKPQNKNSAFYKMQSFFSEGIIWFGDNIYRPIIELAIKMRYVTATLFIGAFAVAVALLNQGWIGFNFMPNVEGRFVSVVITMQEGTPFSRNLQVFDRLEDAVFDLREEMDGIHGDGTIGSTYVQASDTNVVAYMTISDAESRDISAEGISEKFRDYIGEIPDAEDITISYTINQSGPDFNFGIESDSLEDLRLGAEDIKAYLRSYPGVYDVRDRLQSVTDEIRVNLKPGAERFGLTLAQVSQQVRQAYYGEEVQRLPREGDDVRVMVRYPKETRENLDSIENVRIRTADGREIPLSAVAEISYAPSYKRIDRFGRKRSTVVTAEFQEGVDAAALMQDFNQNFIPEWKERHPGASVRERGAGKEEQEFMMALLILYGIALFAMYMLIAIAFSSYAQPILVMTAIPFGFMGAVFGHFLLGENFAMFSFFGIGAAAGVVVNDNLVLIDYINRLRREGVGAYAALVEAGVTRFRPVILTSLTTFIGLVPILLEDSFDAQFLRPCIIALSFGVLFALFVTLLFVPALYTIGVDIKRFYKGLWTGEKQPSFGENQDQAIPDIDALDDDYDGELGVRPSPAE